MAFFNKLTIAIAAFSVLSAARPMVVPRDVVMVTETEYTTIDVPVTLWVDQDGKPVATIAQGGNFAGPPTSVPATSSADTNKVIQRQTGAVTGSSTATCEGSGNACSGDITHWDGGLGACGWDVATATDLQIALPVGLMGSLSNSNPYCNRAVTIQNPTTGQQVVAKVGDKCMGCTGRSIDMTDALFNAVGGGCDGRCPGFVWWFN